MRRPAAVKVFDRSSACSCMHAVSRGGWKTPLGDHPNPKAPIGRTALKFPENGPQWRLKVWSLSSRGGSKLPTLCSEGKWPCRSCLRPTPKGGTSLCVSVCPNHNHNLSETAAPVHRSRRQTLWGRAMLAVHWLHAMGRAPCTSFTGAVQAGQHPPRPSVDLSLASHQVAE